MVELEVTNWKECYLGKVLGLKDWIFNRAMVSVFNLWWMRWESCLDLGDQDSKCPSPTRNLWHSHLPGCCHTWFSIDTFVSTTPVLCSRDIVINPLMTSLMCLVIVPNRSLLTWRHWTHTIGNLAFFGSCDCYISYGSWQRYSTLTFKKYLSIRLYLKMHLWGIAELWNESNSIWFLQDNFICFSLCCKCSYSFNFIVVTICPWVTKA